MSFLTINQNISDFKTCAFYSAMLIHLQYEIPRNSIKNDFSLSPPYSFIHKALVMYCYHTSDSTEGNRRPNPPTWCEPNLIIPTTLLTPIQLLLCIKQNLVSRYRFKLLELVTHHRSDLNDTYVLKKGYLHSSYN